MIAVAPRAHSMTKPELLAPAGDWEAMRAAVANGADAVYFGLDNFNARHRATNFRQDELPEIMAYLHGHNVKGFLTFNTLIFSDELSAAVGYIKSIASAGVDAVIVQDLGLARLIKAMAPSLHVHGSTQMTLTEPRGIEFVRVLGVERVVLARELSIDDIKKITAASTMELEVFVHGALCVAYSGQCLTSEALGGRSANRGQCAQACRLPYDLIVDGKVKDLGDKAYLLSPQDLAAYDLVGDLAQLGVASLKIEGRLKSAHYVAAAAQTYRAALDAIDSDQRFHIAPQQRADLEQTFSRGFTHGFLSGVNHQKLVSARFPKSRGRRIGTVERVHAQSILISLSTQHSSLGTLRAGDGIVFDEGHPEQDEQGGRVLSVTPRGKRSIELEFRRGDVNLSAIAVGAIVWKTDDPSLRKRLEHSFSRDTIVHRMPLDVTVIAHTGEPLKLTITDGMHTAEATADRPLERAQKFPATPEMLREQLDRLGDTPFALASLHAELAGEPMVPKSVLNDLRRGAVEDLLRQREHAHAIVRPSALEELRRTPSPRSTGETEPALHVLARTLDQLDEVIRFRPASIYCDFEDVRRYATAVEGCNAAGIPIALATMRIVKPGEDGWLKQILECQPDAILVRNLAAIGFYQQHAPDLPLIGDYALNIANELTAAIFAEANLVRIVSSYDLNWRQLAAMISRSDVTRFEAVVHQHMPMFHMEHCVFAHTLSTGKDFRDCGRPCERHQVDLKDRVGQSHPLIPDAGCRNTVFNAQAQTAAEFVPRMREMGIRHFRVELLREKPEEVKPLLSRYADVIAGRTEPRAAMKSLRVLNQLGVTRGTLDRE
jgi:U32 family peptidase